GSVAGQRFAFALGVVVELPAEGAAGVFAEQAGERGLVLEGLPDGAGGGDLGGRHGRPGLAHFHRLIATAAGGGCVVVVAGVGGDPVVGAGGGDRGALVRLFPAGRSSDLGSVAGQRFAFALGVVVELPAEGAAGVFAEQAGERGLVLEGLPDGAGGGVLGGRDGRPGLAGFHRLVAKAAGGGGAGRVPAVGGDPPVLARFERETGCPGDRGAAAGERLDDRARDERAAVVIAVQPEVDIARRRGRAGRARDRGRVAEFGADGARGRLLG